MAPLKIPDDPRLQKILDLCIEKEKKERIIKINSEPEIFLKREAKRPAVSHVSHALEKLRKPGMKIKE